MEQYFFERNQSIALSVVFFLAQSATDEVELSFEHIGYVWMSYEHAFKKLTFNNSKELLKKANDFLKKHADLVALKK